MIRSSHLWPGLTLISGLLLAQSPPSRARPELTLHLQPEELINGFPQRFSLILTNTSELTLRLPAPYVGCGSPIASGSIFLQESWQPVFGDGLGTGTGSCCSGGTSAPVPPLVEQAKKWRVLHPGESMYVEAASTYPGNATPQAGVYSYSATYLPPALAEEDRDALRAAGVSVPRVRVTSEQLQYRK